MSEPITIRNLEQILIPLKNEETILKTEVTPLTAPGENFGSIMLRLDIDIENKSTHEKRVLHAVGKLIPQNKKIQEVFNSPVTFKTEYTFYKEMAPILDKLLKSKGVEGGADFVAPFYGGRPNLNGGDVVDSDAVILLQNLKTEGYKTGQKQDGLDLEASKLVLNALAKLHAAGMALKLQDPKVFNEKFMPYCNFYFPERDFFHSTFCHIVDKLLSVNGFSKEEIEVVSKYRNYEEKKHPVRETWGTMVHEDSWTNNFLIKYEGDKPTHAVMVDFQRLDYGSTLNDVMFFLFTSVRQDLFDAHLDLLIDYYYDKFLNYLEVLEVDTQKYTRDNFEKEIGLSVKENAYFHSTWMLYPIMQENFTSVDDVPKEVVMSEKQVQKILKNTRLCFQRGWLTVN